MVLGVGLFGSQSRSDAVAESDIDVLVVERQGALHERVERVETDGLFIDLNYVPQKWVSLSLPPEIDQKLLETLVLYDRDWSLTNAKDWVRRSYRNPERIGIHCDMHLVDADVYLSRASSALARGDFQSACVFASLGLEFGLKIVVEACSLPYSSSRFVHVLRESTQKLGCKQFFDAFIHVSGLTSASHSDAVRSLEAFQIVWDYVESLMQEQASTLDYLHYRIRNQLGYYGNPAFLKGMTARTQAIINSGEAQEACNYVKRTLVDLLENYAWLAASLEGVRLDHSLLFKSLKTLKEIPPKLCENAVAAFNLQALTRKEAEDTVELARDTVLEVRRAKNGLLHNLH
jgi:predicted nucleotidyltransferase